MARRRGRGRVRARRERRTPCAEPCGQCERVRSVAPPRRLRSAYAHAAIRRRRVNRLALGRYTCAMAPKPDLSIRIWTRTAANYAPLTPLSFIERAALRLSRAARGRSTARSATPGARPTRAAGGSPRRSRSAASASGDTVAAMLPNTPAMFEAHFGVPMTGAVLNTLNTRLDAEAIAFMLDHGEAKVLITDREFAPTIEAALELVKRKLARDRRRRRAVHRRQAPRRDRLRGASRRGRSGVRLAAARRTSGTRSRSTTPRAPPATRRASSTTTAAPTSTRVCNILDWGMPQHAVYLWTLPMFHCNGWCFPWTMAANAGTNVCLRKVEAQAIFDLDQRAQRHALLRRADRAQHADQRARGDEAAASTHKVNALVAARGAAGVDDRGHGAHGLRHHARLRPDRDLRPGDGVREARRSGDCRSTSSERAR